MLISIAFPFCEFVLYRALYKKNAIFMTLRHITTDLRQNHEL